MPTSRCSTYLHRPSQPGARAALQILLRIWFHVMEILLSSIPSPENTVQNRLHIETHEHWSRKATPCRNLHRKRNGFSRTSLCNDEHRIVQTIYIFTAGPACSELNTPLLFLPPSPLNPSGDHPARQWRERRRPPRDDHPAVPGDNWGNSSPPPSARLYPLTSSWISAREKEGGMLAEVSDISINLEKEGGK